jgi:hypothetical protein
MEDEIARCGILPLPEPPRSGNKAKVMPVLKKCLLLICCEMVAGFVDKNVD